MVRRVKRPGVVGQFGHFLSHYAAFDVDGEVLRIKFEHPIHLYEAKHNATGYRHAPPAQTGTGAAGDHGNPVLGRVTDDLAHLFGRFRQRDAAGLPVKGRRAVKAVS